MPALKMSKRGLVPVQSGSPSAGFEKSVFIPDAHIPHLEEAIFEKLLQFLHDFQPQKIFILGDWMDFYNLSKFDQDPALFGQLQRELNLGKFYLEEIRSACPKAEGIFLEGNHEDRLRRWLWKNPEIASLMALDIPSLLGLNEVGFDFIPYGDYYEYNGSLIVKHGDIVRMHSAYTAKAELEKHGVSGISGHTHRLGQFNKTDNGGQRVWQEAGCICKMELPWSKNNNWQQGFVYGYMENPGNRFHIVPVPIIKSRFFADGTYYR